MADNTPSSDPSTRWIETNRGVLRYSELAPLLAERVLRIQERIETDAYSDLSLSEDLILRLHRELCEDLFPDLAGKWRLIAVQVGEHLPPPPHLVPLRMRDFVLNLQARWEEPIQDTALPELLAFAEGQFLTIHPFPDLNGRVARLWLWELLRRLRLPPVGLAPSDPGAVQRYLAALRQADQGNLAPLAKVWMSRLAGENS